MSACKLLLTGMRRITTVVVQGFFDITHNSVALIGIMVLFIVISLMARPELRQISEAKLFGWLQERQIEVTGEVNPQDASDRVTATNPEYLPKQQVALVFWLSKKYRVAPEPISALVSEAFDVGLRSKLDPTLILAVMAIESRFNPFAQSPVGAQGLMQVVTHVHSDKYQRFGGQFAAFDPLTNLRVGVRVLQDCIRVAGSIEGGLKKYVGATDMGDDGGYAAKVLAEHARLQQVVRGRAVQTSVRTVVRPPAPASEPSATLALND